VQRIRIALIDLPSPMLSQLIRELLESQEWVERVTEHASPPRLVDVVAETAADILIAGRAYAREAAVSAVLAACPRLRILAVGEDGRRGVLYEVRREELVDLSDDALLEAIRPANHHGAMQTAPPDGPR
jgi:hypothetical protein